jgi:hypothetical protein
MPEISSKEQELDHAAQKVHTFLSDFHNFRDLLPEDKIENWQCTIDTCSFSITGMIVLQLQITEKIPYSKIIYSSAPEAKYRFRLQLNIRETGASSCICSIAMDYNINPFLNTMAEKPLTSLINKMVEKMAGFDFKS